MAVIKHRKLFPAPISSNQTDCPDCPDCTFECYPYAYFYVPPPPPPPPFPSIDQTDQNHHVSPYVILFLSLLGCLFLLIGYYLIIVKSCTRFCSPNRNNGSPQSESSSEGDEEFAQVDHPIWFITTVGLQPSVINSITICKYRKDEGLIEGTECSVCLNEFHEDEMLRLLPKCSHAFHINCIDTWLRSHTNCPLCRAYIVSETHVNSNVVRPNSSSADENWDGIDRNEVGQMEISENQSELGVIGTESEGEAHHQQVDDGNPSKEVVNLDEVPLRRSISMNSFLAKASLVIKFHSDIARNRQSSIEQCLHISPVLMKRSLSCGGRLRLLSFRQKFGMNSVLPL